jgi:hypothetical protein
LNIRDPKVRKYIYIVVLSAVPLLLSYGIIAPESVQPWVNFAAALLGLGSTGLALPNTPDAKHVAE